MAAVRHYETEILKALRTLPEDALPKIWRLILLIQEEFLVPEGGVTGTPRRPPTSHARTRQLLASSTSNWAQDLIAEREERL